MKNFKLLSIPIMFLFLVSVVFAAYDVSIISDSGVCPNGVCPADEQLTCIIDGFDSVEQRSFSFTWFVNGRSVSHQRELPASSTNPGDTIWCAVVDPFPDADTGVSQHITIEDPNVNNAPVVDLPQDFFIGRLGNVFDFSNFVSDDTTPDSNIVWTVSRSNNFRVTINNNRVSIRTLDRNFDGQETLTFTARDAEGLSSSDTVTVSVIHVDRILFYDETFNQESRDDSYFRGQDLLVAFSVKAGSNGIAGIDSDVSLERNGRRLVLERYNDGVIDTVVGDIAIVDGELCSRNDDATCTNPTPGQYFYHGLVPTNDAVLGTDHVSIDANGALGSKEVQVLNAPPLVGLGNDFTAVVSEPVTIPGSVFGQYVFEVEDNYNEMFFAWDFNNDGTIDSTESEPSIVYDSLGVFTLKLTVTDTEGASSSDTVRVTVQNKINSLPLANAGDDKLLGVEESALFDGSQSSDPDGNIVSYNWDFGDGNSASTVRAFHEYSAQGVYIVTLTVTDNRGGFATDTILVRVDVAQNRGGDLDRRIDENTAHKEIHDLALGQVRDLNGKTSYKAGETVYLLLRLSNQGDFGEEAQLVTYVEGSKNYDVRNVYLDVSQNKLVQTQFAVPSNAQSGNYLVKFVLRSDGGNVKTVYWPFIVA
ncbi:MAG: PKD domain-containing protein [Nanoarchaeota archaeon]